MKFLPAASETIVLGITAEKAYEQLIRVTLRQSQVAGNLGHQILFNGEVEKDGFSVSLKIDRPNNFLPLVNGHFEPASKGCLLFLNYSLFQSTKVYLVFWSLFTLITGSVCILFINNIWYAIASFFSFALIQWVAWGNFKIQLRKSREKLLEVLV